MAKIVADPVKIQAAGEQLRMYSRSIRPAPQQLELDATRTRSANTGFRTGMAAKNFAEQFTSLVDRLDKRTLDEGKNTVDSGKAWAEADEDAESKLSTIESDLQNLPKYRK
ncbi:hypothetical protein O1R50_18760 [Glycomyces luteolus]|uniref:Uncharacterized protein n=1 Tax=Glycomyces luteolus TaxID=2670330 RepID=A0A9X3SRQ8_9ACTN|nr:hypothetical protein [Glycomyces luteolus]MDA1361676.1 hypothetical protein [Glycomyces luteolus]